MPTAESINIALSRVNDQASFLKHLLKDEDALGWPLPDEIEETEDISYEWTLDELNAVGLNEKLVEGRIWQLQSLIENQPWGIFLLEFKDEAVFTTGRGMTGILRRVLRGLVPRRRKASHLASWKREHLLFICTHEYKHFRIAYFRAPEDDNKLAPLVTFGWGPDIPSRTACEFNLPELTWPGPQEELDPEKWVHKWVKAFDVEKVTKRFFEEYRNVFEQVEEKIAGFTSDAKKRLFTQRLFNRLMFLRFIEKKGWLEFRGNHEYLKSLFEAGGIDGKTLYISRLKPLFFEALAIPGKQENPAVGRVKYLNGGLFDKTTEDEQVEDIPDAIFEPIIGKHGLFYRHNFTIEESTPLNIDVAVDPEMLGKVFEKLVTGRKEKGAYYTPGIIVSFMCKETLKGYLGGYESLVDSHIADGISVSEARDLLQKLRVVRIVDPACGSGAYLVGMMHELHALNKILDTRDAETTPRDDYQLKLSIIQDNLYGVDLEEFAANTACLRLWLSLVVEYEGDTPEPLPNLDFKIGVGDSLTAPDPSMTVQLDAFREQEVLKFSQLKSLYTQETDPRKKDDLRRDISQMRERIAKWKHPGAKVEGFDWTVAFAEVFLPGGDKQGGFDIVLANPPYGAKVGNDVRDLYFERRIEGSQSKDIYGLFMARALQLIRPGGQFCFIVSDTWRTIKSHLPLRKRFLQDTTVAHVLDLPAWIFDATVNTCILTLTKNNAPQEHQLIASDLRAIAQGDWISLAAILATIATHGPDAQTTTYARYTYPQSLIKSYGNCSFFIGSPSLYQLMSDVSFVRLGSVSDVKVGLQTGDNQFYLRKRDGARGSYNTLDERKLLLEDEISNLTEDEKGNGIDPRKYEGRHFVPYDKGGAGDTDEGWLPNYHVPTEYFIDWSREAVNRLKTFSKDGRSIASRFQNSSFYFRDGITWSDAGYYSPTVRISGQGVFDVKGSRLIVNENCSYTTESVLAILSSNFFRYMIKTFLNHTVSTQSDDFREFPMPLRGETSLGRLADICRRIIQQQQKNSRYPYYLNEQREINTLSNGLYRLSTSDTREVDLWFCRRYPKLAIAQGMMTEVKEKHSDHLSRCERILAQPPGYWESHPILALIAEGEGQKLEFKETLEADSKTGKKHPALPHESLKTICAFANSQGGKLLIGVSDDGNIKGLDKDFNLCGGNKNPDGLELKLRNLMTDRLDPSPIGKVAIAFHELLGGLVCQVEVQSSHEITNLDKKEIWVRDGNRSIRLEGRKLIDWIKRRSYK